MKAIITPRKKTGHMVRSLPIHLWPTADGAAWEEACRPALRLKRGGAASHFRPVTLRDLVSRYGYFLDFLSRSGVLDLTAVRELRSLRSIPRLTSRN
jgi:hypothetical protein